MNFWIFAFGLAAFVATASSAAVANRNNNIAAYQCPSNGIHYDPDNCDWFYDCQNGQATHRTCGWFHRFDEKSNSCHVSFWLFGNVDCSRTKSNTNPTSSPPGETTSSANTNNNGDITTEPMSSTTPRSANGSSTTKKSTNAAPINGFSITLGLFFMLALFFLS